MKTPKSFSIEVDLINDLQVEADKEGMNISQLAEIKLRQPLPSSSDGVSREMEGVMNISLINNNLLIINNLLISKYIMYDRALSLEIEKTKIKLNELQKAKKEKEDILLNSIVAVEEKLSKEQKDILLNMDFGKANCYDLLYKLKQESGLSFGDMRRYVDLVKQKEALNNAVQ